MVTELKADAEAAVSICKYPPMGKRSMTGQLPQFGLTQTAIPEVVEQANDRGSTVFVMIETCSAIENIDSIAAVDGVDVLLIGSNDLSIELGVPGQFEAKRFQSALEAVSAACKKHRKILGLAGIYDRPDLHDWALNRLNARYILAQQDSGWIAKGSQAALKSIRQVIT